MRRNGESVKGIAKKLGVSKGSVSMWTRDIILTAEQIRNLQEVMHKGAAIGRMKTIIIRKKRREKVRKDSIKNGVKILNNIKEREFLIAGLALYWGEGSKKTQEVEFCNSDPKMIKFLIDWLIHFFDIDKDRIKCKLGINEIHAAREQLVKEYWSNEVEIPLDRFLKTNFKKVQNKKIYENFEVHYGTLTISVLRPTIIYHKIIGLIEGLFIVEQEKYKKISQGSSVG